MLLRERIFEVRFQNNRNLLDMVRRQSASRLRVTWAALKPIWEGVLTDTLPYCGKSQGGRADLNLCVFDNDSICGFWLRNQAKNIFHLQSDFFTQCVVLHEPGLGRIPTLTNLDISIGEP